MRKRAKIVCAALCLSMGLFPASTELAGNLVLVSEAHSGRTDSRGGHKDNKNKSGLGSYHYHCGGHPAHLHPNGVCPYANGGTGSSGSGSGSSSSSTGSSQKSSIQETAAQETITLGWQQDSKGWWYRDSETTYKKNGLFLIDGDYYLFNADGYMLIGWQEINGQWHYFDSKGAMVTGTAHIDGQLYYFDEEGVLVEDYFDEAEEWEDDDWD